jgi:hypothetical protein
MMNSQSDRGLSVVVVGLLAVWFLAVLTAASIGVFDAGTRYSMNVPIPLGLGAVLPVAVFGLWFQASSRFRQHLLSINPVVLTTVQVWRVGGIAFLILLTKGMLPPIFALPAGLGDMAVGVTAPFIANALAQNKISEWGFVRWQMAGITDLVVAVTLGVLSSPGRIGILAHGVTTRVMGQLPMTLIPTFAVPLLVILHIICIAQVREARQRNLASFTTSNAA